MHTLGHTIGLYSQSGKFVSRDDLRPFHRILHTVIIQSARGLLPRNSICSSNSHLHITTSWSRYTGGVCSIRSSIRSFGLKRHSHRVQYCAVLCNTALIMQITWFMNSNQQTGDSTEASRKRTMFGRWTRRLVDYPAHMFVWLILYVHNRMFSPRSVVAFA